MYTISLTSLNNENENESDFELSLMMLMKNDTSILFDVVALPFRRLWIYTILAYGCEQHPVTEATYLSNKVNVHIIVI